MSSICQHFPDCGGCRTIDIPYADQLITKQADFVACATQHFPGAVPFIAPIIGCETPLYYRNKMEYAFGSDETRVYLGLKRRGHFDQVIPLTACFLLSDKVGDIFAICNAYFSENQTSTWNPRRHSGLLRHLSIRHSKGDDQYLLNFIVSEACAELILPLAQLLAAKFPEIVSILMSVNTSHGDHALFESSDILHGQDFIEESLGGVRFKISPLSFFQSNPRQAEVLYDQIRKLAVESPSDRILDLYCGIGSIGLYLARHVGTVIGIEENPSAINDAHANAERNGISNVSFKLGKVKNILKFETFDVDCIVTDPPRCGMTPKALKRMIAVGAPRIVYVSCNPVTLFQELAVICENGYRVETVQPVDMFPNTLHVETVVRLLKI